MPSGTSEEFIDYVARIFAMMHSGNTGNNGHKFK